MPAAMDMSTLLASADAKNARIDAEKYAEKISSATRDIMDLLKKHDLTWRDWGEVSRVITNAAIYHFDKTHFITILKHDNDTTDRSQ